jgi:hypothetical protein
MDLAAAIRPTRLWSFGEIVEKGPYRLDTSFLDRRDRRAVDTGGALVGGNVDPRSPHHITAGELVVDSVEPALRVLLGTAVQHALKRLERVHTLVPSYGASPKGTRLPQDIRYGRLI